MQDHPDTVEAKVASVLSAAKRERRPLKSSHSWLHHELNQMESGARSALLDRAALAARSSTRIVWLMAVVASISCCVVLLVPWTIGPALVGVGFGLSLVGVALAHQVNLFVATRQELRYFKALKLAERGEA